MKILTRGSVEDRVEIILMAIERAGYVLRTGPNGTSLSSPDDSFSVGIPRDVMEYLIEADLIYMAAKAH
jgi:hypothetical protein